MTHYKGNDMTFFQPLKTENITIQTLKDEQL